jgi:hypothetical protein
MYFDKGKLLVFSIRLVYAYLEGSYDFFIERFISNYQGQ